MTMTRKRKPPAFGQQLAAVAVAKGITQAELARRLGITQHRVSQIYASTSITEALLYRVAKALRVRVPELFP